VPPPTFRPPPAPRAPIGARHLAALLLLAGAGFVVLADLIAVLTAGNDFIELSFLDKLFLLGGTAATQIPSVLFLSFLALAGLWLREGTEGPFHSIILILGLVVSGAALFYALLALLGALAADIAEDGRFGHIILLLGAVVITAAVVWYAFSEFQSSRAARPAQAPPGPPGYYPPPGPQPPPGGSTQPPPGYYPQA
jgi:hypothetical protein